MIEILEQETQVLMPKWTHWYSGISHFAQEGEVCSIHMKPSVWLDMDPGIDDAWALVMAMRQCHVTGVSTVAGNVLLENTYGNAKRILEVLDADHIPVIPGAANPLLSPLITAKSFHGEGGVGEWEGRSEQVTPDSLRVWTWWSDHASELSSVHLIATGPLTNVAISLLAFPHLGTRWASVTCMCGALPGSQTDKAQEFNVYVDPHAADVVFHWAERVHLIGINVAHKAVIPLGDLDRLPRFGRVGHMLAKMLHFYSERARGEGGNPGAFPIDDVVAVASVVRPDLFHWRQMPLAVVREGPLRGTVVLSPIDIKRPNVEVAIDVDVAGFRNWVWESMEDYTNAQFS